MGQEYVGCYSLWQVDQFHFTVELGIPSQELDILVNMVQNRFYKAKK